MDLSGYSYSTSKAEHTEGFLWNPIFRALGEPRGRAVFDLGCGVGAFADALYRRGFKVRAVDPSLAGIKIAREAYPGPLFDVGSTDDDLAAKFGTFDALTSLEVIEHVYAPRQFAKQAFGLLEPGGVACITTPYHGYWKNLSIAVLGSFDRHFTALWDHGHIKFWSFKTLNILLREAGFVDIRFLRVGRFPPLAKSMIAIAKRPN